MVALLAAFSKSDIREGWGGSCTPAGAAAFWRQQQGNLAGCAVQGQVCKEEFLSRDSSLSQREQLAP